MKGLSFMGFIAPIIALFVSAIWVGISIVSKNVNAKDLVFSYTALSAAILMFLLNLFFSLKGEDREYVVQPHLTITPHSVDVYSQLISKSNFVVFNREKLSSSLNLLGVVENNGLPVLSEKERAFFERNLVEFIRVSVVAHLISEYPDWSPVVKKFRGRNTVQYNNSADGAGTNSFYSAEQLKNSFQLRVGGFDFPGAGIMAEGLTLPPSTKISTSGNDLIIENPHVLIRIDFEVDDGMSFGVPYYRENNLVLDQTDMTKGVVNVQSNIKIKISHKKERAGNQERKIYESWALKIVETIQSGFSPVAVKSF